VIEEGWTCENNQCTTICGDSLIKGEEECDDGNQIDTDECDSECKSVSVE